MARPRPRIVQDVAMRDVHPDVIQLATEAAEYRDVSQALGRILIDPAKRTTRRSKHPALYVILLVGPYSITAFGKNEAEAFKDLAHAIKDYNARWTPLRRGYEGSNEQATVHRLTQRLSDSQLRAVLRQLPREYIPERTQRPSGRRKRTNS